MSDQVPSQGNPREPVVDGKNLVNVPSAGGIVSINGNLVPAQLITGQGIATVSTTVGGNTRVNVPSPQGELGSFSTNVPSGAATQIHLFTATKNGFACVGMSAACPALPLAADFFVTITDSTGFTVYAQDGQAQAAAGTTPVGCAFAIINASAGDQFQAFVIQNSGSPLLVPGFFFAMYLQG